MSLPPQHNPQGEESRDPAPPFEETVALILGHIRSNGSDADHALVARVYAELRQLASYHLRAERPSHSLQPTALVHEAYLRLIGHECWTNRGHFFRVAAKVMHQVLVDHARARGAKKRGGDEFLVQLAESLPEPAVQERISADDLLALDEAIAELARRDPRQAHLVELRFFCGLSEAEVCESLSISPRTARREWDSARAFLFGRLKRGGRRPRKL